MAATIDASRRQPWRRDRLLDLIRETRACKHYGLRSAYWLTMEESVRILCPGWVHRREVVAERCLRSSADLLVVFQRHLAAARLEFAQFVIQRFTRHA